MGGRLNFGIKDVQLKLLGSDWLNASTKLLSFGPQQEFTFLAGQYLTFRIKDGVNRSYSIASAPDDKNLEFIVEIVQGGQGSNYLCSIPSGTIVSALGPLGFFTIDKVCSPIDNHSEFIFIATGTGIAPIRSMVKDLLNKGYTNKITLFWGFRYDTESYLFEEFNDLSSKKSNFRFYPVISRPSSAWSGLKGYCQEHVEKFCQNKESLVFLCGSNKSVEDIKSSLIESGFDKEKIFFEKFG